MALQCQIQAINALRPKNLPCRTFLMVGGLLLFYGRSWKWPSVSARRILHPSALLRRSTSTRRVVFSNLHRSSASLVGVSLGKLPNLSDLLKRVASLKISYFLIEEPRR